MKPYQFRRMHQQLAMERARRVAFAAAFWGLLVTVAWCTSGCASDLDDAEIMADEATVALVWRGTWGASPGLGAPPSVTIDQGGDHRCGPAMFWLDDGLGCGSGAFNSGEFSVRLARRSPGSLAHELAHAAMNRLARAENAPVLQTWSDGHTTEFFHQVCRAQVRHEKLLGVAFIDPDCTRAAKDEIAKEENVR